MTPFLIGGDSTFSSQNSSVHLVRRLQEAMWQIVLRKFPVGKHVKEGYVHLFYSVPGWHMKLYVLENAHGQEKRGTGLSEITEYGTVIATLGIHCVKGMRRCRHTVYTVHHIIGVSIVMIKS